MYEWRGKIGLIVPSTNTTYEMEFHKLIPEGVSIHTSRCFLPEDKTPEDRIVSVTKMSAGLLEAAKRVSSVEPDIVVWACTVGSFIKGKGYDVDLIEKFAKIGLNLSYQPGPEFTQWLKSWDKEVKDIIFELGLQFKK